MIGCRPLEDKEIDQVLDALEFKPSGTRDRALFVLGITSGFRVSELLSLKIRNVTNHGTLNSHIRIPRSRMKGRKASRSAVIAPMVRPYLKALLEDLNDKGTAGGNRWLFQSRKGCATLSRIQAHRILAEAFERAEIFGQHGELGTHCMRKTFASKMWEAHDGNIWKVQNALGHASPASTVAYLSFEESEQDAAVASVFGA